MRTAFTSSYPLPDDGQHTIGHRCPGGSVLHKLLEEQVCYRSIESDTFWRAWSKDYLTLLHNPQKWRSTKEDLKPGKLVMLVNEQLARGCWRLARVEQVMRSSPHVRQVKVRTSDAKVLLRDRTKLVRLELDEEETRDIQLVRYKLSNFDPD